MIVTCPHCGEPVVVNGLGRKRLNHGVINVCDALRGHGSVPAAAKALGCSRPYIYKVLKEQGLKSKDVISADQR